MYRRINPTSRQELPLRMLFQPAGDGLFHRACEADSVRGLVAGMLDEPGYEIADAETRLVNRLRLAEDIALVAELEGRRLQISERSSPDTIDISSDEPFVRSLHSLGVVSLEIGLTHEYSKDRSGPR